LKGAVDETLLGKLVGDDETMDALRVVGKRKRNRT
jgi:hypothetical protein